MAFHISGIHQVHSVEITKLRPLDDSDVHTCEIIIIHDDLQGKSVTTMVDIYCDKSGIEIIVPNQRAKGGQDAI